MSVMDPTGERAMALLSTFVLPDGRTFGEAALEAQLEDAKAVLDVTGPRRHWLGRGRGGSKSTDAAALALVAMVTQAPIGAQLYIGGNDRDQAALTYEAARGWIRQTPHLRGLFEIKADRIEYVDRAVTLHVLAADGPGSWGLLPWMVLLDEVAQAKSTPNAREFVEALLTALPKVQGSRLVVLTTAGSPLHWSYPVYTSALESERWRVSDWTAENGLAPTPWQDPDELEEARLSLPLASFERLFHNVWTSADEAIWTEEAIAALVRPTDHPIPPSPRVGPYVVAVDIGLTNDRTAISVSHIEESSHYDPETRSRISDGQEVICDQIVYFEGTRADPVKLAEVENAVVALARRYGHADIIVDPWQAASMAQNLRGRGFRAVEFHFSASSKQRLASTAINLVRDRSWSLPGLPILVAELRGLRVVEKTSGSYAIDHAPAGHDDLFMSAVLGAHHLLESRPQRLRRSTYVDARLTSTSRGRSVPRDETDSLRFAGYDGEADFMRRRLEELHAPSRLHGRR